MAYKKSGETRDRILNAAAELFSERGYYETGIGDIAQAAGIGRASFYYYFDDKEKAARALFDSYADLIYAAADRVLAGLAADAEADAEAGAEADAGAGERLNPVILGVFVEYILLFRFIALNKATHAVYYDLVNYADYDAANMERLKRTTYKATKGLASEYGKTLSDDELSAFIVTTNAQAKSIFKAIVNGILGFSLFEATDYFFRHAVLPDIPIPEAEYRASLAKAFELCEGISLD
ncbi:MAG: TetR/AcrR family transcriptional regulator [Spirochaetes bacterium]|nr:TetR/AcrR family transcriptional regulator [Spirochaetota bacterium]MBU1080967.1 TetR/AcrR family transcriptional regulator [Spirochaetota bacterium]